MESLGLYILTFNCARNPIEVDTFASHLFDALSTSPDNSSQQQESGIAPELVVLSLQEMAPIAYAFLGGSFLASYFDSFRRAVELAVAERWADTVQYVEMATENCGMTGIMVFARSDIGSRISGVESAEVGLGFLQMGNKGAMGIRLGYDAAGNGDGIFDLTFVAAHLAPREDAFERRNRDWRHIIERLVFYPTATAGITTGSGSDSDRNEEAGDEQQTDSMALLEDWKAGRSRRCSGIFLTSYLFIAGDLNYRTSNTLPGKDDYGLFPQPTPDIHSPRHYSQLLKNDQLRRESGVHRTLHGMSEAPIAFPPTYKYSSEAQHLAAQGTEPREWRWANHRWPSWCDRILYLDVPVWMDSVDCVRPQIYDALPLFPTSDHRAVALSVSVPLKSVFIPEAMDEKDDVRLAPPFPLDSNYCAHYWRAAVRAMEIIVGSLAFLGLTREGNRLVVAVAIGVFSGWLTFRSVFGW
ncbi:hypothetical protein Egran_06852 [Elaphomyces granulatus]|uniref:Inositol polyphosphate-related phosphatase domain-containing protein n=1 Tax=Elaphomyces granulatus TaxID=519963 RepID=A0A232LMJ2_9EURO|nr:hypothetical protein Egran_06852 [Elaphomyces granulatus]